jgi:DNA polymerase III alpha subunit (gram-positive type)
MEKTSVFKKNIVLGNLDQICFDEKNKVIRSKEDYIIAQSLGYNFPNKDGKTYLNSFLEDFNLVDLEYRARYVAVFDFETTDKFNAFAVSMAIMIYDLEKETVIDQFYELINPLETISKGAYEVHKISQDEVRDAKTFAEHYERIRNMLNMADFFVGHNLQFDLNVLERELQRLGLNNEFFTAPYFDTMKAAKDVLMLKDKNGRKTKNPTLIECVEYYGLDASQEFHNALIDVGETLNVFRELLQEEY